MGTIILSALVAHTAWHWTTDRWERLRQFDWPVPNLLLLVTGVRWLIAAVLVAALVWLVTIAIRRKKEDPAVN